MNSPKIHHLSQIDEVRRAAFCSVCGFTQVYIVSDRIHPHRLPRVYCLNKIRERNRANYRRRHGKTDVPDEDTHPRKLLPRHSLSEIDVENMRAICAVCGPTSIRKRKVSRKYTVYLCNTRKREYARQYRLTQRKPPPLKPK